MAAVVLGVFATAAHASAAEPEGPEIQRPRALALTKPDAPEPAPELAPTEPEPAASKPEPAEPTSVETPEPRVAEPSPPPRTPPPAAARETKPSSLGLEAESTPPPEEKLAHRGFTFDGRIGTQACLRALCGSGSHNASPGVRLDGFIGGNIRGFVDLGFSGGWGTMGANVEKGTNALSLYGVNPVQLQQMAVLLGRPLDFNVFALGVNETKLRMARVGPLLRIHFIPRGRAIAYVGSGIGYSRFRAMYKTNGGDTRVDLHGFDVPIEAGGGMQITKHFAVTAQFDYYWTRYPIATLDHPDQKLTLPVRVLDEAAALQGGNVSRGLPQFWSLTLGARVRL